MNPSRPSPLREELERWTPAQLAGQLLVVGFDGPELPSPLRAALEQGQRAGIILFRRNILPGRAGLAALQRLCRDARAASPSGQPPLIAIDEEGGRVARLAPPALQLPPLRKIADLGDVSLLERVAKAVGDELRVLGFTLNFAPVVDVDTNPQNPIIGDRALARAAEAVVELATAYVRGLRAAGIQSCLKHYPGHGDTLLDSHLALPTVEHPLERLHAVELMPFRQLAHMADSMMTAHVLYPALDPEHPATSSRIISTELLRRELGFGGVLFSDDLEMQALAGQGGVEQSAVAAVRAGCDLLLICSRGDLQERARAALTAVMTGDEEFRVRCLEAAERGLELRRRGSPGSGTAAELDALLSGELAAVAVELEARIGRTAPRVI